MYKTLGFSVVFLSAFSIINYIVVLPLFFGHINSIQSHAEARMRVFKENTKVYEDRMSQIRFNRERRDVQECPEPVMGPPGINGLPGADGRPGKDGKPGLPGLSVYELIQLESEKCIICPQGLRGPIGGPGITGKRGMPGDNGDSGNPGENGAEGEVGLRGARGISGPPGLKGAPGPPGKNAVGGVGPKGLPGPIGRPGVQGPQGPRGQKNFIYGSSGLPGNDGADGADGFDGLAGKKGPQGARGEPGNDAKFCPCKSELERFKTTSTTVPSPTPSSKIIITKYPSLMEIEDTKSITINKDIYQTKSPAAMFSTKRIPYAKFDRAGVFTRNFFPSNVQEIQDKLIDTVILPSDPSYIMTEPSGEIVTRWNLSPTSSSQLYSTTLKPRFAYIAKTHRL